MRLIGNNAQSKLDLFHSGLLKFLSVNFEGEVGSKLELTALSKEVKHFFGLLGQEGLEEQRGDSEGFERKVDQVCEFSPRLLRAESPELELGEQVVGLVEDFLDVEEDLAEVIVRIILHPLLDLSVYNDLLRFKRRVARKTHGMAEEPHEFLACDSVEQVYILANEELVVHPSEALFVEARVFFEWTHTHEVEAH